MLTRVRLRVDGRGVDRLGTVFHPQMCQVSGPRLVAVTRLQGLLYAAARAIAPSKEAHGTPLSPPLNGEPGRATGRSGAYSDGNFTRRFGPACRTQHTHQLDPASGGRSVAARATEPVR
jgi:hypothetical protein